MVALELLLFAWLPSCLTALSSTDLRIDLGKLLEDNHV
jgi:hypothetical protein